ncbi:MAG: DUF1826 domain-containing protein [Mangrovicoccus sp.]|nr:DUF1826 domain-containing protein [Mangrovicoccus sp.]
MTLGEGDARTLVHLLAALLLEVRLEARDRQASRKWHLTWSATGRSAPCAVLTGFGLGRPDGDPATVQVGLTSAVGLFRGLLWPGRERLGIVHRSPPVRTGETRLVLVIDPVDEAGTS